MIKTFLLNESLIRANHSVHKRNFFSTIQSTNSIKTRVSDQHSRTCQSRVSRIIKNHNLLIAFETNTEESKRHSTELLQYDNSTSTSSIMTSNDQSTSSKEQTKNERSGMKFGADTAYDSDSEYVSALPTDAEEQMMLAGESVKAREQVEYLDEGRVSAHPSTLAASNKASSAALEVSFWSLFSSARLLSWRQIDSDPKTFVSFFCQIFNKL